MFENMFKHFEFDIVTGRFCLNDRGVIYFKLDDLYEVVGMDIVLKQTGFNNVKFFSDQLKDKTSPNTIVIEPELKAYYFTYLNYIIDPQLDEKVNAVPDYFKNYINYIKDKYILEYEGEGAITYVDRFKENYIFRGYY